jgi:hypothetical protein
MIKSQQKHLLMKRITDIFTLKVQHYKYGF